MLRPLYIALLEAKRYLKDRRDLGLTIALPIAIFALSYGAFSGSEQFNATAHIVDLDRGIMAQELLARLEAEDGLILEFRTLAEADESLDRSGILSAMVIPEGFTQGILSGQGSKLLFKQRGEGGQEAQIIANIVAGVTQELAGEVELRRVVHEALEGGAVPVEEIDATVTRLIARAKDTPPMRVTGNAIGGGGNEILSRMLPGILTMFLLFSIMQNSQVLVQERRAGTLERLLTTRLTVNQLFAGKFLAGMSRGMLQSATLLTLAFVLLRIAGTSAYIQVMLFSLLITASVSAVGLVIGTVAKNRDQATWPAVFVTMYMTVFGGTFFAIQGGFIGVLSGLTLNKYAIDALSALIEGETLAQQGLESLILIGVTVVGLLLARSLFKASQASG
jgi:ABC-2 type transport system permease protein